MLLNIKLSSVPVVKAINNIKIPVLIMFLIPISLIKTMNVAIHGKLVARTVQATTSWFGLRFNGASIAVAKSFLKNPLSGHQLLDLEGLAYWT